MSKNNYKSRFKDSKHQAYREENSFICERCKKKKHIKLKTVNPIQLKLMTYDSICLDCFRSV